MQDDDKNALRQKTLNNIKDVESFAGKLVCYQSEDVDLTPFRTRDSYGYVESQPTKALSSVQMGYSLDRFSPEGTPCVIRYLTNSVLKQNKTTMRECTSDEKLWLKTNLIKKTWSTDLCSADLALRMYFS